MHELSVATELYRSCRVEVDARCLGATGRLRSVTVHVGELSGVEPELLGFAWEAVTVEGPDQGAKLEIEWCTTRQTCDGCGRIADRQPGTWLRLCPACSQPLRLEGGDELDIREITFDTEQQLEEVSP
ncbi:MAG: hydrogenase maturation nickel metallochaperone HypA/HybF [Planctomycetota bacterium]|jgi:hydrogenase nickel incorporation protein HypA/HybF